MLELSYEELEEYRKLYRCLVMDNLYMRDEDGTIRFHFGVINPYNPNIEDLRLIYTHHKHVSKIIQQFPLLVRKIEILNALMI